MTAPAASFDEWLTDHLDGVVNRFYAESRDDGCHWLFLQFAQAQYCVFLFGEAAANGELSVVGGEDEQAADELPARHGELETLP